MARRNKSEPILEIISALGDVPWWVGLVLAAVTSSIFQYFANRELPPATDPSAAMSHLFKALAGVAQYALPIICLAGSGNSIWRRYHRERLVTNVSESTAASALDEMSWREFETLVGEAFRLQGYHVTETGGGGADGGVDLVLAKGRETFLVQCKQWKAFRVSVDVVRELYGVMAARGAAGGFVVTSGRFTDDATAFATGRNVKLIDGPQLFRWIQEAKGRKPSPEQSKRDIAAIMPTARTHESPACPVCASPMVRRTARRGSNSGNEFWGCPKYPKCSGTRDIVR